MAGVVAGVVVLAGCSSGGDGEADAKPSVKPTLSFGTPTADPTGPPVTRTPSTPEGKLDQLAEEKGWVVDGLYEGSAAAFVDDMCETATSLDESGIDPGERFADHGRDGDNAEIMRAGMPKLCPKWSKVALAALKGDYVRTYGAGTYVVKANPKDREPGSDEPEEIGPGTYRTEGDLEDCYWERTSRSGEILDNNFATSAQEITVTIRSTDGQFTTRGCGTWKKVG